ncbi:MAG: isoleucine--tRNA ligase [Methylocystaceae bacterium]
MAKKGKYDETLNLPRTEFSMRANLPIREPEFLQFWQDIDIYRLVEEQNAAGPRFELHDGPPYANGHIHLGHTLNKVLKDIIIKSHTQQGYSSPYVPGWDTHGLPIEQQAIKNLGLDRHRTDVVQFRQHCREYALKFVDIQREEFKRLGVRGDWDHPYVTLDPEFEAVQLGVFGEMAKKGYIYKGLKPVYWCADCETALAEAEVEYADKTSPSIYVAFPVVDALGKFAEKDTSIIIWTTTPWTLPANTGIALNAAYEYVLVEVNGKRYIIAKELLTRVAEELGFDQYEIIQTFLGKELERIVCFHPFLDRQSLVILGDHVTLEAGTGCVHTAPGHGEDDFWVGRQYDLPIIVPINDQGVFTAEAGPFAGKFCVDANEDIIKLLKETGYLLKTTRIQHQYPHCWRCKKPILFRATEQWFASIDGFRTPALEAIDQVRWIPGWGRDRIYNMVRDRGDWCISRQRTWGVPIPIFYCGACEETVINDTTISYLQSLYKAHGSDVWFARAAKDLLPEGFKCPHCGASEFKKETDIMDVWFDSGSSHLAVLTTRPQLSWPADMYLEGSDQHRGWFNSSLSTSVAVTGKAPYRQVLTHGFVVDEDGRKMSKSLGNVVDPLKMIEEMGADILRLWVSSADYRNDVAASPGIMKQVAEAYRKIRNTSRFLMSNLYDFDQTINQVAYEKLSDIDRWALARLGRLINRVEQAYQDYEFHVVYHAINSFCTVDMSAVYLDIVKDTLYCSLPDSQERRAVQTVLTEIIHALVRLLSPVLAFTSEEIWQNLKNDRDPVSVQLAGWPTVEPHWLDDNLEAKWDKILKVREVASKALETARQNKVIGHSLAAQVTIYADEEQLALLKSVTNLEDILIVSSVKLEPITAVDEMAISLSEVTGVACRAEAAPGDKCERCWKYSPSVGGTSEHPTVCGRCAQVV